MTTARFGVPAVLLIATMVGCGGGDKNDVEGTVTSSSRFRDATVASGLDFTHTVELAGAFDLPEIMGSGCAVFDADGDGDLDVYVVDGGVARGAGRPNRLFLRDGEGRYSVASASGLEDAGFGMGVALGDVDGDGDLDVYVANFGPDRLYINQGGGRFEPAPNSGIEGRGWSSSVAMADFDGDGHLDIWVVRYVIPDLSKECSLHVGRRDFCSPKVFKAMADLLYRGRGDGTFTDASVTAGISRTARNGLGIIVFDAEGDGDVDVFCANDGQANSLWLNDGRGRFRDEAVTRGCAVNEEGAAEASMGVAIGDVDGDGFDDLFMTHLVSESNTLYRGGPTGFDDATRRSGLHGASVARTGFGTSFGDLDLDGDLDLVVVNGRVGQKTPIPGASGDALWQRYGEPEQIYLNDGHGRFKVEPDIPWTAVDVSRGLAMVDIDQDGDLDMVVTACRGRVRIYENVGRRAGHWLAVRLAAGPGGSPGATARVTIRAGDRSWTRSASSAVSYLTAVAAPCHFGLGAVDEVDVIEVRWPGGRTERFAGGPVDRIVTVRRGEGQ